ncbi:MAG TPA: dTMP kinase [Rickettsiales bacterium]|nr:dTMP kinase [Rickettsiales bacterium]
MAGKFITFEGGEGSGKTTQISLLEQALVREGRRVLVTREPGGSVGGDAIRQLLLTGSGDKWSSVAEVLLFQAARVEHMERVIKPAIARGDIVLCDRFLDSSLVYQGMARGLGVEFISQINRLTIGNFAPDATIILDIETETGLRRAKARPGEEMRFENLDIAFHRKVREGFLTLAKANAARYRIVDASKDEKSVHQEILAALQIAE